MLVSTFMLFYLSLLLEGQNWCNAYSYKQSPAAVKMTFQITLQEMWHSPCVKTTVGKCVCLSVQKGAAIIFMEISSPWRVWFLWVCFVLNSKDSYSNPNTRGTCTFSKYFPTPVLRKCCPSSCCSPHFNNSTNPPPLTACRFESESW